MKLTQVKIQYFRSIKSLEFMFPESGFLVLVGANNAGKSNIIRAINMICGEEWVTLEKMQDHDFYGRVRDNLLSIQLTFNNDFTARLSTANKWPEYKDSNGNTIYSKRGNIKEDFPCTYLGADRTFDRHMAFYDWTLLGKIRKTFHQRCVALGDQLNIKFQEIVDLFDRVEGFSNFKADFSKFFAEMQADAPLKMAVNFKPFTPNNYFKTMQILAADPAQGQTDLDLEELGEGTRNLVLLALLRSYAVNLRRAGEEVNGILALEEPEIYMHPQSQRNLFRVLRDITDSGIQVLVSTHSGYFVDTEFFDSIGVVRKVLDEETPQRQQSTLTLVNKDALVMRCRNTGVPESRVTVQNIMEYYKSTSNYRLNEAFFARIVILVEGESEEFALPEYLGSTGLNCDMRGVSLIAVEGKNQLPKYWRLFSSFKIPMIVIFDNDDDNTDERGEDGDKRKSNKNIATCFGLGLATILHSTAWSEIQSVNEPKTPIFVLGNDFETAVEADYAQQKTSTDPEFATFIQMAKDVIKPIHKNQGKGLIARYVARKILSAKPDYCPAFVRRIVEIANHQLGFVAPSTVNL